MERQARDLYARLLRVHETASRSPATHQRSRQLQRDEAEKQRGIERSRQLQQDEGFRKVQERKKLFNMYDVDPPEENLQKPTLNRDEIVRIERQIGDFGNNVNATDEDGNTALHHAAHLISVFQFTGFSELREFLEM